MVVVPQKLPERLPIASPCPGQQVFRRLACTMHEDGPHV